MSTIVQCLFHEKGKQTKGCAHWSIQVYIVQCLFHEKGKQAKGCAHWSIQVNTPVLTNGRTPSFVYLSHEIDNALYTCIDQWAHPFVCLLS